MSRGGHLVLVKVVLETIPHSWISLAWVPKSVLETIRKFCYKFNYSRDQKKKGLMIASWKNSIPKAIGGWGLKNPFLFSKALAPKNVWRPIQRTGLWV